MADPTARINANKGGIAPLITTEVSIFEPTPYEAYNIFAVDDSALTEAIGQPAAFGQVVRFPLRKRGGRVGKTYVDVEINVPVTPVGGPGGVTAAWVDDLGANLLEEIKVKYSSKDVHTYRGEALKFYQRIMDHDITKEHYNGNQLAGLPGVNGEQVRSNTSLGAPSISSMGALTAGVVKLRVNLDWIWWTKEDENALATEALASEIIVEIKLRPLQELIYSRLIGAPGTVADPFATPAPIARPTITECTLHHELVFTPKVEASKHLARYENRRGLMFKILDFEEQLNNAIAWPNAPGGFASQKIVLNNFRLDSQFLMFVCRDDRINTAWAIDRGSSDNTYSNVMNGVVTSAAAVPGQTNLRQSGALVAPKRFRVTSNGSTLIDWCDEFENRGIWRNKYFPGSQINGAVYFIPFAKKLREFKHVHGYQNMSNLGNVILEIEFERPPTALENRNTDLTGIITDVYNICHNVIQMAQGDIVKALR